ncbi:MAG: response regulator [Planctomycetes bacterium]|nr:response regulator [Planctomycetota bacterium]
MNATKKVLVCDDEPHIVHVVAAKLRNAGFDVTTASDGQEGLAFACAQPPDLVITDYQMPFLSGLELCAKLKSIPATSKIPIIMLTARGFSLTEADLVETSIRRVIVKPFSPREVLAVANEILLNKYAPAEVVPS